MNNIQHDGSVNDLGSQTRLTHIIYALYAISGFTAGLTGFVAILINYIKRDDVKGTFLASHFSWQIRTYWWSLVWGIIGLVLILQYFVKLMWLFKAGSVIGDGPAEEALPNLELTGTLVFIGIFVLFADAIWVIYRIVKGWLKLNESKPVE